MRSDRIEPVREGVHSFAVRIPSAILVLTQSLEFTEEFEVLIFGIGHVATLSREVVTRRDLKEIGRELFGPGRPSRSVARFNHTVPARQSTVAT